jgi:hypothetical protein
MTWICLKFKLSQILPRRTVQWPQARLATAPSPLFFSPNWTPPCTLPISSLILEPFSILFLVIEQAQATSTTHHCRCAMSSGDKAPRPSLPLWSRQKGARTPPPAPHAHHPTQDPWSRLEIKFFPLPFGVLPPPHGSPSSSKLPAATPSASPGSLQESRSLAWARQPERPSRYRTTMEARAISSSELLCRPRRVLVLHECHPSCCGAHLSPPPPSLLLSHGAAPHAR